MVRHVDFLQLGRSIQALLHPTLQCKSLRVRRRFTSGKVVYRGDDHEKLEGVAGAINRGSQSLPPRGNRTQANRVGGIEDLHLWPFAWHTYKAMLINI